MNKVVSIIIPTFNGLPWLSDAIDSAMQQTYKNCEIIVIDDGSNDGTKEFIKRNFIDSVEYYYKENSGLPGARNFGLEVAKGDYIQFLDSDDLIPREKVKNHIEYLKLNEDVDIVYSHCKTFYSKNPKKLKDWDRNDNYSNGQIFSKLLKKPFLLPHMPLSRKSVLLKCKGFDTNMNCCIDYDFWLRVAWLGANFHYLNDGIFVLYRLRNNSLSSSSKEFSSNGIYSLKKFSKVKEQMDETTKKLYEEAFYDWIFKRGRAIYESGNYFKGLIEMFKGLTKSRGKNTIYKICFFILVIFINPKSADKALIRIKSYLKRN